MLSISNSHKPDLQNYWRPANYSVWESEIVDAREMLIKYGNIPRKDIKVGSQRIFLII